MDRFKHSQTYLQLLYCLFTLIVGFQIARILYYRHALVSFQLGFLILCFIWGVLRIILWSIVSIDGSLASGVLLWIPINVQFATFSLLVVFYAHLVHKGSWERYTKKRFAIAYFVVNTALLVMNCVSLGFSYSNNPKYSDKDELISEFQSAIAGLVFLILVTILAWYGYRLHKAIGSTAKHQMLFQVPPGLFAVTAVIIFLFLTRCIYDFIGVSNNWVVDLTSDTPREEVIIFFAYFSWEIVPAAMIIVLFWRIPTTHIGGISRRGRSTMFMLPPSAIKPVPSAGIVSRLFNDPQRYDSDDETTGFLHKGAPITYTTPPKPSSYTGYSYGKNTPYATTPRGENPPENLNKPINTNNNMKNVVDSTPNSADSNPTTTPPDTDSAIIPGNA